MRPLLPLAILAAAFVACGGSPPRSVDRAPDLTLEVTFADGHDRPPGFDPASPDPRVRKAYAQLVGLVGHDFRFHFDEALLPRWTTDFDTLFARGIETIVEDLADLRRSQPEVFRDAAPRLAGLDVSYRATALDVSATLDAQGMVRVVLPPDAYDLVPARALSAAILESHDRAVQAAYVGRDPAALPRGEWAGYWAWLERAKLPRPASADPGDDLVYYVDAQHVLAAAHFAAVIGAGADDLHGAVEHWLVSATSFFRNGYEEHEPVLRALPPTSTWKRAEQAWTAWASGAWPTLSDGGKQDLIAALLGPRGGPALPLDVMPMGLDLLGAWVKAGHPASPSGNEQDGRASLLAYVICPSRVGSDGRVERSYNCGTFWDYALGDDARRKRLIDFVVSTHDAPLAVQVVLGSTHGTNNGMVVDASRWPLTLAAWRGLGADDGLWRAATRTIGDGMTSYGGPLLDETVNQWRQHARPRGPLLYVLASLGAGEYPVFKPAGMVATLGAPIARSELDDELGLGGRALAMVATLWPALGDGWSRADVIGAHLDAALDEAMTTPGGTREVAATLERIGAAMCSGRDASGERARLRARVAARAKSHPDESPALLATADALAQGCK